MNLGEKIKKERKIHGYTQETLAKRLGVQPTAVSAWERNANKPMMDKITIMAELFNKPISFFFDVEEFNDEFEPIPLYGKISCGDGAIIYEEPAEYKTTPKEWTRGGEYFYLRAKGDSMTGARINEGDLLLIRKQDVVENGEIAAVVIDDEVVLKRVYKDNGTFTLVSENPKHPPKKYDPKTDCHIRIIGKLKKLIVEF